MKFLLSTLLALACTLTLAGCLNSPMVQTEPAMPKVPSEEKPAPPKKAEPLDINSATESQLKTIPGVGDAIAKKIIAGRPYTTKDELVTKQIIPKEIYVIIRERITVMKGTATISQ